MILDRGKKISLLFFFLLSCLFISTHYQNMTYFPVRKVQIIGAEHTPHDQIERIISPVVKKGFFSIDSTEIKDRIIQFPWVAHVVVQRIWPNEILISIIEKVPAARWNQTSLISEQAQIFNPPGINSLDLPEFIGADGQQEQILSHYRKINSLIEPLHFKISKLELTPHSLWKITFKNGIKMTVGQRDFLTRLDQFVKLYPKIVGDREAKVEYIDLRYVNGISVKWKT